MSHVTLTTAGRPWALRFYIWVAANDGGRPISVDLLAPMRDPRCA